MGWQLCSICNREMHLEFNVEDKVWLCLPKHLRKKHMCIECFLEALDIPENEKLDNCIDINDFYFMSIVNENFGSILKDD